MREPEAYRPILESVLAFSPKHVLSKADVMAFTGKGKDWVKTHIEIGPNGITAEALAIQLSKL